METHQYSLIFIEECLKFHMSKSQHEQKLFTNGCSAVWNASEDLILINVSHYK